MNGAKGSSSSKNSGVQSEGVKLGVPHPAEIIRSTEQATPGAAGRIAQGVALEGRGSRSAHTDSLTERLLFALKSLSVGYQPHPCGGFTTDDMEWRLGTAFTGEEALREALDELCKLKLIRYAGYDGNDAIGHCYELVSAEERRAA